MESVADDFLDDFISFADSLPPASYDVPVPPSEGVARPPASEAVAAAPARSVKKRPISLCSYCRATKPQLVRPKTGCRVCKSCFLRRFEDEIHHTIVSNRLFRRGQRVILGASGGKDSTVLAHVMHLLNERYDYGLDLVLLSIDEGIVGYRDDSLETVKRNEQQYQIPLTVLSYKDLYGWTMDEVVRRVGTKGNCTFCGVFRRQALGRGAMQLGGDMLLTGHNCDDIAETVMLNLLRGDIARLTRCIDIVSGRGSVMPRAKPFKFTYEKEIVMYAHYNNLDYFSTECKYAPFAYRNFAREYVKDLERVAPQALLHTIVSAEAFCASFLPPPPTEDGAHSTTSPEAVAAVATSPAAAAAAAGASPATMVSPSDHAPPRAKGQGVCGRCGYISSRAVCKACLMVEELATGADGAVDGHGGGLKAPKKGGAPTMLLQRGE